MFLRKSSLFIFRWPWEKSFPASLSLRQPQTYFEVIHTPEMIGVRLAKRQDLLLAGRDPACKKPGD
jgi:hypothetical protein